MRIQSMTNTDTKDVGASISQCEALIRQGCELVRLTTQGKAEVEAIGAVREALHTQGLNVPVVADIHFKPGLAELAAVRVDKIRINPGNYTDRKGDDAQAGRKAREQLNSLISLCKTHQTAIRIGVNHGSLSERILRKYGDTAEGMVASAMEFVRICASLDFHKLVVSLKSSNARVMVQSVRLLVATMMKEGIYESAVAVEGYGLPPGSYFVVIKYDDEYAQADPAPYTLVVAGEGIAGPAAPDAGLGDAGLEDALHPDAGLEDACLPDAGLEDAPSEDATPADAGVEDIRSEDAPTEDTS